MMNYLHLVNSLRLAKMPKYRRPKKWPAEYRVDEVTGLEYRPLTSAEQKLKHQHIHPLPDSLEMLFASFLKPAIKRDRRAQDYDRKRGTWRIDWPYHKQNYRREAILYGITQAEYAKCHHLCQRRTWAMLHTSGGASIKALFWVYHRHQLQIEQHENGMDVETYIEKYQLSQRSAARQLLRKPMGEYWSRCFDIYYKGWWPKGYTVSDFAYAAKLKESTVRQYLFDFPSGLFNPMLIKPYL